MNIRPRKKNAFCVGMFRTANQGNLKGWAFYRELAGSLVISDSSNSALQFIRSSQNGIKSFSHSSFCSKGRKEKSYRLRGSKCCQLELSSSGAIGDLVVAPFSFADFAMIPRQHPCCLMFGKNSTTKTTVYV